MAKRQEKKLTPLAVNKISKPGMYGDGLGLWLQVSSAGAKSWIFRYTKNGNAREMGLGPIHAVKIDEAREAAARCRKLLQEGKDPIAERDAERLAAQLEAARALTFDQCAAAYIEAHRASWSNPKHVSQWGNTLAAYASPVFGHIPVASVDTDLIVKALASIWTTKTETATRVRQRIENVLDWAAAMKYRAGDNPAKWKGHLENLLAKPAKVKNVAHHPALPYSEVGAFMAALRQQKGVAALALEFLVITAARTGDVIGAKWREIDLAAKVWTVPAERFKTRKEHRVPLSPQAIAVLRKLQGMGEYVFPGGKESKPLSNAAMLALLKRMYREDIVPHGFRSTFRDWAAELTAYPHEVAEMALGHAINNKVESAYRRGDLFSKRANLMDEWARYCDIITTQGAVLPFKSAKA